MPSETCFHEEIGELVRRYLEREGTLFVAMSLRLWAHAVETMRYGDELIEPRKPSDDEIMKPLTDVLVIMASEPPALRCSLCGDKLTEDMGACEYTICPGYDELRARAEV